MKKIIIIISINILVIFTLVSVLVYINIKANEKKVIETAKYDSESYSIKQTADSVIETKYNIPDTGITKVITTYTFTSNNISGVKQETHYQSISLAKNGINVKFDNATFTRKDNVVTGIITDTSSFSGTQDSLIKKLEENDKNFTKVEVE